MYIKKGENELDTIYLVEVFGNERVTYDGPRKVIGEEIFEEYPSREQILFTLLDNDGIYANVKQLYVLEK